MGVDISSYVNFGQMLSNSLHHICTVLILTIILIPSAIADARSEKIPNLFSMSGWVIGPVLHFFFQGMEGLAESAIGFLLLFGLTFPLWMLKWFGAADVKLMASVGAIVGGTQTLVVLFGIVLTGLAMSIAVMLYRGTFFIVILRLFSLEAWRQGKVGHEDSKSIVVPYGIPIAFGSMLSIIWLNI